MENRWKRRNLCEIRNAAEQGKSWILLSLEKIIYIGKSEEETTEYERYVAQNGNNLVSKWENVSFTANVIEHETVLLLFQVVIPQGSQGFYAAIDNVELSDGRCASEKEGKLENQ